MSQLRDPFAEILSTSAEAKILMNNLLLLDPQTNTILLEKMREVSFVDPSGSRFYFVGQEGSTSRDIHLFDGTAMTMVGCVEYLWPFDWIVYNIIV